TIAASSDTNRQKKLLFGYSAAGYNSGRSKLEIADNAGLVLRGNPDGTANTLIDMIAGNSTYYTFVDSGAFTAEYSSFTNMDQGGIQLSGNKGVAISSSTFDFLGFASGDNAYITARDLTSNATSYGVSFGLSRSSAGYASAYNVRVETSDAGLFWHFMGEPAELGSLWGEAYNSELGASNKVLWGDLEAPSAVTGLAYSGVFASSITLNWLAPGDDGMLGVLNKSSFTVQYATYTSVNWSTGSAQINISTSGVEPGTSQYYTLTGLAANTTHYFRVWAKDEAANYGPLSSGATALTLIETPTSVYFDEVGTTSIVASAYASSQAFTGMERGISGVAISTGTYDLWGSTGNYWTSRAVIPITREGMASGVISRKVYAVGGYGALNANTEYDPASNIWTIKAIMPTARWTLAAGVVGGRLYAVGGYSTGGLGTNEEYDLETDTWTTKAVMPTVRNNLSAGVIGGKLYAIGGGESLTTYEEYDPAINVWSTKAPMNSGRWGLATGVISGKIYAVGGLDSGAYKNINEEYDPVTNTWVTKAVMPTPRYALSAEVIGGKLYAIGGTFNGSNGLNTNEEYDPATDTWNTKAAMPTARYNLSARAIGGKMYAFGGTSATVYKNANEEYTPGTARTFSALTPNTLYTFKTKARNQAGVESGESALVSTYTLAAVAQSTGPAFTNLFASSVTVNWSSGTASGGFNGIGASYVVEASTMPDFLPNFGSWQVSNVSVIPGGLNSNTTYYFRAQAYNAGGMTDYSWLALGSTVTHANTPNAAAAPFGNVNQEGTDIYWGKNGNSDGTAYSLQVSSHADFSKIYSTVYPLYGSTMAIGGLTPNTTWYARAAAVSFGGAYTDYYVIGSTLTRSPAPTEVLFIAVSSRAITTEAYSPYGFPNLSEGLSGISLAISGAFSNWQHGTTGSFTSLKPNKEHFFSAMARNQTGHETAESPVFSTYTLAAVAQAQAGTSPLSFIGVSTLTVNWSSGTTVDGFNGPGATYLVSASTSQDFNPLAVSSQTLALSAQLSGLEPNTTYFVTAKAANLVGVLGEALTLGDISTLAHPVTGSAVSGVYSTSVTINWNALSLVPSSDSCEGYLVSASTEANFSGVVLSSASPDPLAFSLSVPGLFADATYYFRVGSLNWSGAPNYASSVSTKTQKENVAPTIDDKEDYDYVWRSTNSRSYDVDFADEGGSALSRFMVKAATAPLGAGLVPGADWTDVVTGISSDSYTTDWQLPNGFWDLLRDGTNYVSILAYDGSGNTAPRDDAFVVFKDTTPPVIFEQVDSSVWHKEPGAQNAFNASDPHSLVDGFQYGVWSSSGQGGIQLIPWTDISSNIRQSDVGAAFIIDPSSWTLLQSGTNYAALRGWDYSVPVNTGTYTDAFVILKDTVAPGAINSLASLINSTYSAQVTFSTPPEFPSGLAEFAVQYASYTVAWATSSVAGSSHVYVSSSGISGGAGQIVNISSLAGNTTYYFRAWSRDLANNWSALSNGATAVTLAEPPVLIGAPAVYVSSAALSWTPVDSRGYVVDASTAGNFSGVVFSSSSLIPQTSSLSVSGLSPNTTYYFRAGSLNWGGLTNYGDSYAESTYAIQPGSASVFTAVSSVSITVEWLSNSNGPGTRYAVEASSDEFLSLAGSSVAAPGSSPYALTFGGLFANTTYWFKVQALGNHDDNSAWLMLGSTVTTPVPPILLTYSLWSSSASVTWDPNGNGGGTLYECDLSTAAGFSAVEVTSRTASLALELPILSPNTTYYMRLRTLSAVTQPSPYVQSSGLSLAFAPSWLAAFTVGPNSAWLYWDAARNPGGLSGGTWSVAGSLPAARYGHAAAISGDTILISGGSDGSGYKSDAWYAPLSLAGQAGAWTEGRSLPAARYGHTSVALKGRLYIIGGYDGTAPKADVWSAPISSFGATGDWVAETSLTQAVYAHASAVFKNFIYVLGGYGAGARTEVWRALVNDDGTLGNWTSATALPEARYSHAAALSISTSAARIYVTGGNDGSAARAEAWTAEINPNGSLSDWTAVTPLSSPLFAHGLVATPGALFAAGGNNGSMARQAVLRAAVNPDGTLGAWMAQPELLQAVQSHALLERGGRLLALGGYDGAVSKQGIWLSSVTGTEYALSVTDASFSSTPWLSAGNFGVGGLKPNILHTFAVAARNFAGVQTGYSAPLSTYTYAAQPSTAAFINVFVSSIQVNWLANDNPAGTVYNVELSSDAAHAQPAGAMSVASSSAVFTGLADNYTYYARARAVNDAAIYTAWTTLGSTSTRANPQLDFSSPTITDNQAGDNTWRTSANGAYDIDFADTGGAYLSQAEIKVTTGIAQTGTVILDWTPVITNINSNSYTADFILGPSTFSLLSPGTNYVSVRVFDGNGNSSTTVDAFYILKDTAMPVITDSQLGETDWRMDDAGAVYNVDFADGVSGLGGIEYSASLTQGVGNAAALAWRPIAVLTPGTSYYGADWAVDFAALANNATNFISVRAWDLAGNMVIDSGVDVFKILKY
ncbi:MAG: hypothetical protein Q7R35_13035, partial [Elusimicrobiota bacterium]|nr:hypothetical protein [Elusimicrobiota bacterium]